MSITYDQIILCHLLQSSWHWQWFTLWQGVYGHHPPEQHYCHLPKGGHRVSGSRLLPSNGKFWEKRWATHTHTHTHIVHVEIQTQVLNEWNQMNQTYLCTSQIYMKFRLSSSTDLHILIWGSPLCCVHGTDVCWEQIVALAGAFSIRKSRSFATSNWFNSSKFTSWLLYSSLSPGAFQSPNIAPRIIRAHKRHLHSAVQGRGTRGWWLSFN